MVKGKSKCKREDHLCRYKQYYREHQAIAFGINNNAPSGEVSTIPHSQPWTSTKSTQPNSGVMKSVSKKYKEAPVNFVFPHKINVRPMKQSFGLGRYDKLAAKMSAAAYENHDLLNSADNDSYVKLTSQLKKLDEEKVTLESLQSNDSLEKWAESHGAVKLKQSDLPKTSLLNRVMRTSNRVKTRINYTPLDGRKRYELLPTEEPIDDLRKQVVDLNKAREQRAAELLRITGKKEILDAKIKAKKALRAKANSSITSNVDDGEWKYVSELSDPWMLTMVNDKDELAVAHRGTSKWLDAKPSADLLKTAYNYASFGHLGEMLSQKLGFKIPYERGEQMDRTLKRIRDSIDSGKYNKVLLNTGHSAGAFEAVVSRNILQPEHTVIFNSPPYLSALYDTKNVVKFAHPMDPLGIADRAMGGSVNTFVSPSRARINPLNVVQNHSMRNFNVTPPEDDGAGVGFEIGNKNRAYDRLTTIDIDELPSPPPSPPEYDLLEGNSFESELNQLVDDAERYAQYTPEGTARDAYDALDVEMTPGGTTRGAYDPFIPTSPAPAPAPAPPPAPAPKTRVGSAIDSLISKGPIKPLVASIGGNIAGGMAYKQLRPKASELETTIGSGIGAAAATLPILGKAFAVSESVAPAAFVASRDLTKRNLPNDVSPVAKNIVSGAVGGATASLVHDVIYKLAVGLGARNTGFLGGPVGLLASAVVGGAVEGALGKTEEDPNSYDPSGVA